MAAARDRFWFFDWPRGKGSKFEIESSIRFGSALVVRSVSFRSIRSWWMRFTSPTEMAKGKTIYYSVIVDLSTSYASNSLISPAPRGGKHTKTARS